MKFRNKLIILLFLIAAVSCKKEIINEYHLDNVHVPRNEGQKGTLKSDLQFISIAYSDLFGKEISESEKNVLLQIYNSVGDKNVVVDMIIRAALVNPALQIPSDWEMLDDPEGFIDKLYSKLLTRAPSEIEKWYLVSFIRANQGFTVRDFYYLILSCDEYRYY